jgi:23S rRNA pseudouridine2457 synthase
MAQLILFNKPLNVLSQFTGAEPEHTLAYYINQPGFYPAGRLDKDSEGLLLLTDCGITQQRISNPRHKLGKTYWAQVEGEITEIMTAPQVWERYPPIRERRQIPDSWLALTLFEGRNRQVRRMTAAVGFPTLRLIRHQIGNWQLGNLQPGESRKIQLPERWWQ